MKYKEFWQLIDATREAEEILPEMTLVEKLRNYSQSSILDFEYMLREFLAQLHHRNILATYKTVVGCYSEDGYLYFRCWIIGQGKAMMQALLNDEIAVKLSEQPYEFEALLYVADAAFEQNNFEGLSPREAGQQYLDYDDVAIPLKG